MSNLQGVNEFTMITGVIGVLSVTCDVYKDRVMLSGAWRDLNSAYRQSDHYFCILGQQAQNGLYFNIS